MITDDHCHFHGGLPSCWIDQEIEESQDPADVLGELRSGREVLSGLLRSGSRASVGLRAFFSTYRAIERHCAWMEHHGTGSRDLYRRGLRAVTDQARDSGVTRMRLFFSLTNQRAQMLDRVAGLVDTIDSDDVSGAVQLRLTVPRARFETMPFPAAELQEIVGPLLERGALVGLDLSGLESEVDPATTLRWADALLEVRASWGDARTGVAPIEVSVHSGETLHSDVVSALQLIRGLSRSGINAVGHGTVLWCPEAYDNGDHAVLVEETLQNCLSARVTFELCPAIARLYGADLERSRSLARWRANGGNVVFGTDAPGLVGYTHVVSSCQSDSTDPYFRAPSTTSQNTGSPSASSE